MKKLTKSLVMASAMTVAGSASADIFDCFCPFLGVDYYQAWMYPQTPWNTIFPKQFPGGTLYTGAKFSECFGFEVGYDTSVKKSHAWNLNRGITFFNGTTTVPISGTVKMRRSGGHIDFLAFWPFANCFEFFGAIGWGYVEPKFWVFTNVRDNIDRVNTTILSLHGEGRSVLRLGAGVNYMLTDCIGVRAKVGYESTSSLRIKGNPNFTALGFNQRGFRGTGTFAAGAFIRF